MVIKLGYYLQIQTVNTLNWNKCVWKFLTKTAKGSDFSNYPENLKVYEETNKMMIDRMKNEDTFYNCWVFWIKFY